MLCDKWTRKSGMLEHLIVTCVTLRVGLPAGCVAHSDVVALVGAPLLS